LSERNANKGSDTSTPGEAQIKGTKISVGSTDKECNPSPTPHAQIQAVELSERNEVAELYTSPTPQVQRCQGGSEIKDLVHRQLHRGKLRISQRE